MNYKAPLYLVNDSMLLKWALLKYEVKKKHTGKKQRRILSSGEKEQLRNIRVLKIMEICQSRLKHESWRMRKR